MHFIQAGAGCGRAQQVSCSLHSNQACPVPPPAVSVKTPENKFLLSFQVSSPSGFEEFQTNTFKSQDESVEPALII